MEKEYIVGLKRGVDFQKFNSDMVSISGAGAIPPRNVTVANQRPLSQRLTHYMLTDDEAQALRLDARVECVEIPPEQRDDIQIKSYATQEGNFTKTTLTTGPFINWGLRRTNEKSNIYGSASVVSGGYNHTLDGSGVDVVVQDTGIEPTHPEWQDAEGTSRLKKINWYTESGLTGTQNTNHYRDYHGHGTHVGATMAGKNYGWAKGADIYAQKVAGLEGTGDSGTGISVTNCFDVIKEWHNRKAKGAYTPTGATYTGATGVMVLTIGNHNFVQNDKIRIAPGSLVFTCAKDSHATHHPYPRSRNVPNAIGTDPYYNKDVTITATTATTITMNIGISSDTSEHRFVSAIPGCITASGSKRLQKKRPTVVNMSWGYSTTFTNITGGVYRGTPWTGNAKVSAYGMIGDGLNRHNVRVSSVDIDIQEMIDAGIHVVIASGNAYQKIDVPTGVDYDNYYTNIFGNRYYHRGGSPFDDQAINVGNIDRTTKLTSGELKEQKRGSSNCGPGVDIYAPGSNIMSACSTLTAFPSSQGTYYFDGNFKQANISGTSMAAPQVAGVIALYLQINPEATVKEVKDWLIKTSISDTLYDSSGDNDYTDFRSLLGGANIQMFNPYNSQYGLVLDVASKTSSTVGTNTATYTLTSNVDVVDEGGSFTVSLATANVTAGTSVPYTITGISANDLSSGSLTGNFVVGTTDNLTFTLASDATTEGLETISLNLDDVGTSISIIVVDTSLSSATYTLNTNTGSVNEGSTFTVTLGSTNAVAGTSIPYTITGVTSADINNAALTGSFVVGTTESITYTVSADATTEGSEIFTMTLDGTSVTVSVTIGDTSTTPIATYTLASSAANVDEGSSFTLTLTTTNVTAGTLIPYTITGVTSADIGDASLTGQFVVGSSDSVIIQTSADQATEGPETFTMTLDGKGVTESVTINDTSVAGTPTYTLARSASNVDEGSSFTITLTTTNIGDGTTVPYTITGVTTGDINNASLTGNFTINNNTATLDVATTADVTTEGAETFTLTLNGSGDSIAVTINDTSQTGVATYSLGRSASDVDEGNSFTITLTTTNVVNGTTVPYTITGVSSADINSAPLSGNFTINNNTATLDVSTTEDLTTEGDETFTLTLTGSGDSIAVTINDTSVTYSFTPDYTISVTNTGNSYNLTGTDRSGAVNGSNNPAISFNSGDKVRFNINASTSSSHPFYVKTQSGGGTGNQASGVNGAGTTQVDWTIGSNGTFYYQCSVHGGMYGQINVS